ncbi:hypothetical protein ACFP81_06245 [Deinococcus lacus]|uniref:Uncharacterized protein n=1 Tax=Deinococcus lacus TaxID=392561 RepID=A0ABW1YCE8_9DEIO
MTKEETTTSGYVDTDQTEVISEGMQGATGEADANGLGKDFGEEQLEELSENLSDL